MSGAIPREQTGGRARLAVVTTLVAFGAVFLLLSWGDISGPFGQSDEGANGAVFGLGTRAYRELGPLPSVFGGRLVDGRAYATHPPLLWSATAFFETVLGEHRWSTRAAAWLGSLAVIALFYLLARALGLRRPIAVAATIASLGTAMFFTYGWMLDTPIVSFPLGILTALVWQRRRTRAEAGHPPPRHAWVVPAATAFLTALSGWEATMFVTLLGLWSIAERFVESRRRPGAAARPSGWPYVVGAVSGFVVSVGWGAWVYGDLQHLWEKFQLRSGGAHSGLVDVLAEQGRWTVLLLGIGLVGLVGAGLALRDPRFRPIAAVSLATVVGYTLVFRGGAAGHPYWEYWSLLPCLVGYSYLFDRMGTARGDRARIPDIVVVAVAGVIALVGIVGPNAAKANIEVGMDAVRVLEATPPASSQTTIPFVGDIVLPEEWMDYEFGRRGQQMTELDRLGAWARDQPDAVVLVGGPCPDGDRACALLWDPRGPDYQVLRGREVSTRLGSG